MQYASNILSQSKYHNRTIIESQEFNNLFYEIKDGGICVNAMIENRHIKLPFGIRDGRRLVSELAEIIDTWEGL